MSLAPSAWDSDGGLDSAIRAQVWFVRRIVQKQRQQGTSGTRSAMWYAALIAYLLNKDWSDTDMQGVTLQEDLWLTTAGNSDEAYKETVALAQEAEAFMAALIEIDAGHGASAIQSRCYK